MMKLNKNQTKMLMIVAIFVIIYCIVNAKESLNFLTDTWLSGPGIGERSIFGKVPTAMEVCRVKARKEGKNSFLYRDERHETQPNTCNGFVLTNFETTKKNTGKPGNHFACVDPDSTLEDNCAPQ
jgi:hypothetical protein